MSSKTINTIAIVDSGVGGISVLKALINKFRVGNYIYFADNLFMPYGNKTKAFIEERTRQIITMLKTDYKVDLIIIACNTMSSVIKDINLSNVCSMKFNLNLTYIATPLTKKMLQGYEVIGNATLAEDIEKNIFNAKELERTVKKHVKKYKLNEYNKLVLGCTHYELAENLFKKFCPNTEIINNSNQLINNINITGNNLNIVFIQSKRSQSYEDKIKELLRRDTCVGYMDI